MVGFNFEIPDAYEDFIGDFLERKHKRYSLYGGRNSCKSTTLYFLELMMIMTTGNVMVIRRYKNSIANSCLSGIERIINEYKLDDYFEVTHIPARVICKQTKYSILFAGLDDPNKLKSAVFPIGKCKLVVFEETQEFKNKRMCDEAVSSFERGIGSDDFVALYIWNVPPNKKAWQNVELTNTDDYQYALKVLYKDVPIKFVGAEIDTINRLMKSSPNVYRSMYLGEPISAENSVFENVRDEVITDEQISIWERDGTGIYCGLDFGFHPDPNAAVEMYYDRDNRILYIFREMYRGGLNNLKISYELETNGFDQGFHIIADSASNKDIADLKDYGWYITGAIKGKGSLEAGFKFLQGLNAIVVDARRCENTYEELISYHYEVNDNGSVTNLYKWADQADHAIASIRYGLEPVWRRAGE